MSRDHAPSTEWLALLELAAPLRKNHPTTGFNHSNVNWPRFLTLAQDHGVLPLVADRIANLNSDSVPEQVRSTLQKARRAYAVLALQLTSELSRVLQTLAEAGIATLVTKGPALSVRCYGDPGIRQYGDLDLIVREADVRRVTEFMLDLPYEARVPLTAIDAHKVPGEYLFRKPGTNLFIDFHTERTFRYYPRPLPIETLFHCSTLISIDGRPVPVLSIEDELLLISVHGAKHFWERLMWVADVAALISASDPIDWNRTLQIARDLGAERVLRLSLRLASDLFDAELPPEIAAAVCSDHLAGNVAAQIRKRLASHERRPMGLVQRAAFRVRTRGDLLSGINYLLRLSLSPTEEDWTPGQEGNRSALAEVITRPFRLARKHSRPSDD